MKAVVVSNSVTGSYVDMLAKLFPNADIRGAPLRVARDWLVGKSNEGFADFYDTADLVVTMEPALRPRRSNGLVIHLPAFAFRGLHPDAFNLEGGPPSVLLAGTLYSKLITVAFMHGWTREQAARLFDSEVYEACGYFAAYEHERTSLIGEHAAVGIDIAGPFDAWRENGNFLHTFNHPKHFVLVDLLLCALVGRLISEDVAAHSRERLASLPDALARSIAWPVYPDIGRRYGIEEPLLWRQPEGQIPRTISVETFVARTFDNLRAHPELSPELIPDYDRVLKAIK